MENHFKITIILVISFNIIVLGYFYKLINVTPSPQHLFEKTTHAHYKRKARSIDENSIVFIGSSSIQGLDVSQIANHSVNLGIGGERISGLIGRLREYHRLPQSRLVVIAAGFNDLCHLDTFKISKKFSDLINEINELKVPSLGALPMVISAIQPAINIKLCKNLSTKIVLFNQYLKDTCHDMKQCYFVDLPKVVSGQTEAVFETDGIHLNQLGYQLWKKELSNTIKYALNEAQGSNSIQ